MIFASRVFWACATERAVKTFAQVLIPLLGGTGVHWLSINWQDALGVAGLAALASLFTSIASATGLTEALTPRQLAPPGRHVAAPDGTDETAA